jgi:uncharacterized membrane protein YccF (DUF307 family)
MRKTIQLFFVLVLLTTTTNQIWAQGSDMVVLRKGPEKTLKTYIAGSQIHFISIAGNEVEGSIKKIERDSIFIHTYDSRAAYTMWGTSFWDTVSVSLSRYHVSDIREIIKPKSGFGFIKNGYLFMVAGISYAILHVVNAPILDQPIIPGQLAIAGGITATGVVLNRVHKRTVKLGKKYHLQYIPLN